jgi:hypothetical protein
MILRAPLFQSVPPGIASQEGIVDLQKFVFDAQYVLYFQTVYFIAQQYIVLRSNLVDLTKIYF